MKSCELSLVDLLCSCGLGLADFLWSCRLGLADLLWVIEPGISKEVLFPTDTEINYLMVTQAGIMKTDDWLAGKL